MIILGIDPGTASTGYGIIKVKKLKEGRKISANTPGIKKQLKCLGYGVINTTPALTTSERLKKINNELSKLIKVHNPEVLVVENRLLLFVLVRLRALLCD